MENIIENNSLNTSDTEEKAIITENKKKEKAINIYMKSDEFKKLIKDFKEKWEKFLPEIKELLYKRKKTELTKSEVDKKINFIPYLKDLVKNLWDSEWEKILKDYFSTQIENFNSHILHSVEALQDAPMFTNIDLLKQKRNDYCTTKQRIEMIRDEFNQDVECHDAENPYC